MTTKEEKLKILKEVFESFGKVPTVRELEKELKNRNLFSIKTIDRVFGGVKNARELLGYGNIDMRTGSIRGGVCIAINERGLQQEEEVYKLLCKKFGEISVHREKKFGDSSRRRVDFFVYSKEGSFVVDVFYPQDMQSMGGCLNNKIKKYDSEIMNQFPVIFLMTNDGISGERLESFLRNRRKPFVGNQQMMTLEQFHSFLGSRSGI